MRGSDTSPTYPVRPKCSSHGLGQEGSTQQAGYAPACQHKVVSVHKFEMANAAVVRAGLPWAPLVNHKESKRSFM
jgi:hypothetical protein